MFFVAYIVYIRLPVRRQRAIKVLLAVNTLRDLYFACQSVVHIAYYSIEL